MEARPGGVGLVNKGEPAFVMAGSLQAMAGCLGHMGVSPVRAGDPRVSKARQWVLVWPCDSGAVFGLGQSPVTLGPL